MRAYWILDCTFSLSVGEESSSELLLNVECVRDLLWNPECALVCDPTIALISRGVSIGCIRSKEDHVGTSIEPDSEIEWNLSEHPPRSLSSTRHPESARTYHTSENERFQVFSMTSEGPHWRLFVCYRRLIPEVRWRTWSKSGRFISRIRMRLGTFIA